MKSAADILKILSYLFLFLKNFVYLFTREKKIKLTHVDILPYANIYLYTNTKTLEIATSVFILRRISFGIFIYVYSILFAIVYSILILKCLFKRTEKNFNSYLQDLCTQLFIIFKCSISYFKMIYEFIWVYPKCN